MRAVKSEQMSGHTGGYEMKQRVLVGFMVLFLAACGGEARQSIGVEFLTSGDPTVAALPFSEAVRVGNMLYLSGQIGNLPGTLKLPPGGIGPETEQTLTNIKTTLERHGSSLEKVVKCTVFLADIGEWPAMNEVYKQFFGPKFPARSAVAGSGLALGARVEIECFAIVDE